MNHDPRTTPAWTVVVPVKGGTGKSRLAVGPRERMARAIALDTVAAVARAARVAEVVIVTSDPDVAAGVPAAAGATPARVVADPGAGLNAAVAAGAASADPERPRAALLGDLPALDPADLDDALARAEAVARGFVADAEDTGTTLLTAGAGAGLVPLFGSGSRDRHAAAGYTPIDLPTTSSLRRDVDTADQLRAAAALGLGPRTSALLEG
ncbi:2-phospho-L-lactate guanylyltransferase [Microbacterium album]|uniref:2-phospho-L-lactate guanylyltransferase n=1 Tax=Microbacterium album TaxID=2053191 RepID=A0A917IFL8_9MICO|nr:2-phospho-L-lactate guanylyltransferase [Microbacterium album]GGH44079.1 2-phospho-L-lactate guanylyltransferase [Microbacterium album]